MYQAAHSNGICICLLLLKRTQILALIAGQTKQKTNELQRLLLMQLASGKEGDMHNLPLLTCPST